MASKENVRSCRTLTPGFASVTTATSKIPHSRWALVYVRHTCCETHILLNGTQRHCIIAAVSRACEVAEAAGVSLCFKRGVCINEQQLNATTGGFFACECEPGYVGPQCNGAQPNPCDQAPCQNGATCIALPELDTKFLCKCPNGFEGDLCESTTHAHSSRTVSWELDG